MSGIAGIVGHTSSRTGEREIISRMLNQMKHEDFYSTDIYANTYIALGITSLTQDNRITFNPAKSSLALIDGEVFGLKNEDSKSDIELIVQLYEKEDKKFLATLNGWFSLIIYDYRTAKVFVITDRYGFKPLYYTEIGDTFVFASEIKSILVHPAFDKQIDYAGVSEYALLNYPLGERTFVKNVHRVPPASIWCISLRPGSKPVITKKNYYDIGLLISKEPIPADESVKECGKVFNKVVYDLVKSEPQIGLTLTAGYDTRVILSALKGLNVKCLTYGSNTDIQAIIARRLAYLANYEHYVQQFDSDFIDRLNDFLSRTVWITDGLCNLVHCGSLYVFTNQRALYSPSLSYFLGFGGSELIRGVQNTSLAFSHNSKVLLLSKNPLLTLHSICKDSNNYKFFSHNLFKNNETIDLILHDLTLYCQYNSVLERVALFTILEIFRKYYWPNISLIESQVRVRLPYMYNELIDFIFRTPFSALHTCPFSNSPFERLRGQKFSASIIEYNAPQLLYTPTDRGYSPYWNLHSFGYPIILLHQARKKLIGSHSSSLSYELCIREKVKLILEEMPKGRGATSKEDYFNYPELQAMCHSYPNWSMNDWQSLSKIATLELWLRQFLG